MKLPVLKVTLSNGIGGAAFVCVAVALGCGETPRSTTPALGELEFVVPESDATRQDIPAGHIELQRFEDNGVLSLSYRDLTSAPRTRTLPVGLYSVAWRPEAAADAAPRNWTLRGPSVVAVYAGRKTCVEISADTGERLDLAVTRP